MRHTIGFSRLPVLAAAFVIALAAWGASKAAADGAVDVVYSNPESYTDLGDGYAAPDSRRNVLLDEIRRHLRDAAAARIPAGTRLRVAIRDIDMAGAFEPSRGARYGRVRIFRDGYPPRIRLEFTLVSTAGAALNEGSRDLTDLAYLASVEHRSDILRYEKKLLSDWLAREFPQPEVVLRSCEPS